MWWAAQPLGDKPFPGHCNAADVFYSFFAKDHQIVFVGALRLLVHRIYHILGAMPQGKIV